MGCSYATQQVALAAITHASQIAGYALDRNTVELKLALRGLRNLDTREQRQAKPIRTDQLERITAGLGDTTLERRDAALLLLLFSAALRRSELSGIDLERVGTGTGYLAIESDTIAVVLLRSKNATKPVRLSLPKAQHPQLASALKRWIQRANIKPAEAVFRSVRKGGTIGKRLAPGGVSLTLQTRIYRSFLAEGFTTSEAMTEAKLYSGHSGRVGMYVEALEAGMPLDQIARFARHQSLETARRYARARSGRDSTPLVSEFAG